MTGEDFESCLDDPVFGEFVTAETDVFISTMAEQESHASTDALRTCFLAFSDRFLVDLEHLIDLARNSSPALFDRLQHMIQ